MSSDLKRIIEGLLFISETPMSVAQLARAVETDDLALVREILIELITEYEELDRAFTLVEVAGGYAFRTRPELAAWLVRGKRQSESRLSQAALETLAIVAYKQPVLKAEIERLRGVAVDGVLRMLMEKDLLRVAGRKDLPGRPLVYGTTRRFLEIFGLKDLKDLPTLQEMEAIMGEMEPVLADGGDDSEDTEDQRQPFLPGADGKPAYQDHEEEDTLTPEAEDQETKPDPEQEAGQDLDALISADARRLGQAGDHDYGAESDDDEFPPSSNDNI